MTVKIHVEIFSFSQYIQLGHDLLPFYPSDLNKIWYASFIPQYAWTFFVYFLEFPIFSTKYLFFKLCDLVKYRHFHRHDLLPFYQSDLDKIWYAPYMHQNAWTFFVVFKFFRQNTYLFNLST